MKRPGMERWLRAGIGVALLAAGTAAIAGWFDGTGAALGGDALARENRGFLELALHEDGSDIVLLAELLAILNIVGSADLGFDFIVQANVQVGQAVSAVTLGLERAMIAIAASAVIGELLIGLNAVADALAAPLAIASMLAVGIYSGVSVLGHQGVAACFFRAIAKTTIDLFLIAYLLIPYSIHATGWTAEVVLDGITAEHRERLHHMHHELSTVSKRAGKFDAWSEDDAVKSAFTTVVADLEHKVSTVDRYVIGQLSHALLLGLFVPLGTFVALWLSMRRVLGGLLGSAVRDPS